MKSVNGFMIKFNWLTNVLIETLLPRHIVEADMRQAANLAIHRMGGWDTNTGVKN